jgi:hypothetical protein
MNYAYQHAFGDIWNDFDHPKYRDHVFAYPVTNGVIRTVQWEGFREAVDDVRYLTAVHTGSISSPINQRSMPFGQSPSMDPKPTDIRRSVISYLMEQPITGNN